MGEVDDSRRAPPAIYAEVLSVAGAVFLIAALISILSFMPRVDMRAFLAPDDAASRPENPLFYGEIRKIPIAEFPNKRRQRYEPPKGRAATEEYLAAAIGRIRLGPADMAGAAASIVIFTHDQAPSLPSSLGHDPPDR